LNKEEFEKGITQWVESTKQTLDDKQNLYNNITSIRDCSKQIIEDYKQKLKIDYEGKEKNEILKEISNIQQTIESYISKYSDSSKDIIIKHEKEFLRINRIRYTKILKSIELIKEEIGDWQICQAVLGPSGIRSNKLQAIVKNLNINIESFLQELNPMGYSPFEFNNEFVDIHGFYSSMSKGERKRVDIAIALSIMSVVMINNDCNILFLDEMLDSLDPVGVYNIIDLLRDKCFNLSSTFLITHNSQVKNAVEEENVVTIVKQNDRTVIKGDRFK
jgi:DNA repair exonuclease SbcCD ATPase subunit